MDGWMCNLWMYVQTYWTLETGWKMFLFFIDFLWSGLDNYLDVASPLSTFNLRKTATSAEPKLDVGQREMDFMVSCMLDQMQPRQNGWMHNYRQTLKKYKLNLFSDPILEAIMCFYSHMQPSCPQVASLGEPKQNFFYIVYYFSVYSGFSLQSRKCLVSDFTLPTVVCLDSHQQQRLKGSFRTLSAGWSLENKWMWQWCFSSPNWVCHLKLAK